MLIFEKVKDIYGHRYICPYCLGRMFSILATNTTNLERGESILLTFTMESHSNYLSGDGEMREEAISNLKLLAEKANFKAAQQVLQKEGISFEKENDDKQCYLCHDIFDNLDIYLDKAKDKVKNIEFETFLVGTSPDGRLINKEDQFKAKLNIFEAESFKSHFNREVGKLIADELNKEPEFSYPDITLIYSLSYDSSTIRMLIRSVFIYGRYKKLIRGIPQTQWPCRNCHGAGCEDCDFTGKTYQNSVEEYISPQFLEAAKAEDSKFHGAGREDIDVRMLGTGRPFILELENPKIRTLNLQELKKKVNAINKEKVEIQDLRFSDKNEVIKIKEQAEDTEKTYKALVSSPIKLDEKQFNEKLEQIEEHIVGQIIDQRTPSRVSHRRADKIRKKKIYKVEGSYLDPSLYEFIIKTQGGTYIKELITSDEGRTKPSFSEIFNTSLECKQLDVININY